MTSESEDAEYIFAIYIGLPVSETVCGHTATDLQPPCACRYDTVTELSYLLCMELYASAHHMSSNVGEKGLLGKYGITEKVGWQIYARKTQVEPAFCIIPL